MATLWPSLSALTPKCRAQTVLPPPPLREAHTNTRILHTSKFAVLIDDRLKSRSTNPVCKHDCKLARRAAIRPENTLAVCSAFCRRRMFAIHPSRRQRMQPLDLADRSPITAGDILRGHSITGR